MNCHFTQRDVTAFVFTNGRSTLPFCLKALKRQSFPIRTVVIRDLTMASAIRSARETCTTPFLMKVDDDFLMHPRFIEFALEQITEDYSTATGLFWWHLWENWSQEVVQSVKIYPVWAMWEVPFEPDEQGRIDLIYLKEMKARNFKIQSYSDIVGVHCCGNPSEQQRYTALWKKQAPRRFHHKAKYEKMLACRRSVASQYADSVVEIDTINKLRSTRFHQFVERGTDGCESNHHV